MQAYNVYDDFFSGPTHDGEPVPLMVGMMGEGAGQNATHELFMNKRSARVRQLVLPCVRHRRAMFATLERPDPLK